MVMTVLEAQVARDRVGDLGRAYGAGISQLPPDIVETFLARDSGDTPKLAVLAVVAHRKHAAGK